MTLIELMVASVIFLVGILGLATLQVNAMKANMDAFKMTEGTILISDRIEQLAPEIQDLDAELEAAIADQIVTYDFARLMEEPTEVKTSEFAEAVVERM